MVEVNLYQPGKVNATIQLPTEWNELLIEELQLISKTLLDTFDNASEIRAAMLTRLIEVRNKLAGEPLPKDFAKKLDAEDVFINGFPLIDFIFNDNKLTSQPYPRIKFFLRSFIGPESNFDNLTCGEYEDAEIFFHQFIESPSSEPLAQLAAILWRPKNVAYIRYHHRKGKFIAYDADKKQPLFMKLPEWKLFTIYTWYAGCRKLLPEIFPTVHETNSSKDTDEPDMLVFTKCIHAGAGPKNRSRDQIRCMLLKEFFMDMELEAIKVNELKRKYGK
jgi:hypothetical protein